MDITERFLNYVKFDTQSSEDSNTVPSTAKQLIFAKYLKEELENEGFSDVEMDDKGYIYATLKSNMKKDVPTIGFISHYDTSPDCSGENVKPRIIRNYDGKDILLDAETQTALTLADFPELAGYKGQTLLVTDGKTLLGADDKAGVAEIVCAIEYLVQHPEIKHGPIKVAFTPDEEIGQGVKYFDTEKFGCDFGYTMDGGAIGELEFENFNAASASIKIQGRNIHPGYAKNKMVNSQLIAMELNAMLPEFERPQYTQDYEGFFLLIHIEGCVENTQLNYIIRDHDREKFEGKKKLMQDIVNFLNLKYDNRLTCEIKDQYYNMREKVEPVFYVVERAIQAMEEAGVKPIVQPIRGGTDGANLSFRRLPCPNIFAGGHNFHGKYEYVPLESMVKAVEVIVNIAKAR